MRAVDLFAGWGGFTLGAEQAGVEVVWAANHWDMAVEAHAINHPETEHHCQDLTQADWTSLPEYELLLASPACPGHSTASQPRRRAYHDESRATAWAVVDCAEVTHPETLIVENVPAFQRWQLYPIWKSALRQLGYTLEEHILRASHYGVPQRRDRLFIVGSRVGATITPRKPCQEPAIGPCIDWADGQWRPRTVAGKGAQKRMRDGHERHGDRFLSQHTTGHRGISLDEPIRTITAQDHWLAVDGDMYRPLTIREYARGMGFPDTYAWPETATRTECVIGLGNAVCPPKIKAIIEEAA